MKAEKMIGKRWRGSLVEEYICCRSYCFGIGIKIPLSPNSFAVLDIKNYDKKNFLSWKLIGKNIIVNHGHCNELGCVKKLVDDEWKWERAPHIEEAQSLDYLLKYSTDEEKEELMKSPLFWFYQHDIYIDEKDFK